MKFTAAVSIALAGSVCATSSDTARDISSAVQSIAGAVQKFGEAVKGYSSGSADALVSASKEIASATSAANAKIGADDPLTLTDALGIQPVVTDLEGKIKAAMDSLVSAKSSLVASQQGCKVQAELANQGTGAASLQKTITGKVPSDVAPIAAQLSSGISDSISKAVTAYQDACSSGAGASSSGSSSGASNGAAGAAPPSGGHSSSGHSGSGSGSMAGGSGSGSSSHSGSSGSGSHGSRTSWSTTASGPKPAVYTGAASSLHAPIAIALGAVAFAL